MSLQKGVAKWNPVAKDFTTLMSAAEIDALPFPHRVVSEDEAFDFMLSKCQHPVLKARSHKALL